MGLLGISIRYIDLMNVSMLKNKPHPISGAAYFIILLLSA